MVTAADLRGPEDLRATQPRRGPRPGPEIRGVIIDTVGRDRRAPAAARWGSWSSPWPSTGCSPVPTDKIVWDTGHQAYAHKLLTGRLEGFGTLRQLGGVGGFPRRVESAHDIMDGGHAAPGCPSRRASRWPATVRGGSEHVAVVVGDAALMSGLSLEALNDIGQRKTRMVILLNDNEMSISPTVGAVSQYLSRIKLSPQWRDSRRTWDAWRPASRASGPPCWSGPRACATPSSTCPSRVASSRTWA